MKTTQPASCPLCGEGRLHQKEELNEVTYEGVTERIPLYFLVCDACGSDQVGNEESRRNKRTMLAFRKRVDGFLTGAEIRAMRQRWDITQQQAAKIFGGGPVAFSKYENDDLVPSDAMNKLLRVADAVPAAFGWLAERAGLPGTAIQAVNHAWELLEESTKQIPNVYPLKNYSASKPKPVSVEVDTRVLDMTIGAESLEQLRGVG